MKTRKQLKKLLAGILSVALLLSAFPLGVLADEGNTEALPKETVDQTSVEKPTNIEIHKEETVEEQELNETSIGEESEGENESEEEPTEDVETEESQIEEIPVELTEENSEESSDLQEESSLNREESSTADNSEESSPAEESSAASDPQNEESHQSEESSAAEEQEASKPEESVDRSQSTEESSDPVDESKIPEEVEKDSGIETVPDTEVKNEESAGKQTQDGYPSENKEETVQENEAPEVPTITLNEPGKITFFRTSRPYMAPAQSNIIEGFTATVTCVNTDYYAVTTSDNHIQALQFEISNIQGIDDMTQFGSKWYCADPYDVETPFGFWSPPQSATLTGGEDATVCYDYDAMVGKILYYGRGGPAEWQGFYDINFAFYGVNPQNQFYQVTHMILGAHTPSKAPGDIARTDLVGYSEFLTFLQSAAAPPSDFKVIRYIFGPGVQDMYSWAFVEPDEGKIKITKTSANPDITSGNSCYSFENAKFGIYATEAAANADTTGANAIEILTTDANGQTPESGELEAGTYWVKELVAPEGFMLPNPNTAKSVTVEPEKTATVTFADVPNADPIGILLQKRDPKTGERTSQGNGTLANAQFTVKYYDNQTATGNPLRTWIFKTDADGFTYYHPSYLVTGNELFVNENGFPTIPIGTIIIEETQAPTGYLINDEIFIVHFTVNEQGEVHSDAPNRRIDTTNQLEDLNLVVDDNPKMGGIRIFKMSEATEESTHGDATVSGIRFAIFNKSENPVKVNDVEYEVGEIVKVITVNAEGTAQTGQKELPYGSYGIQELRMDAAASADLLGEKIATSSKLGTSTMANASHKYRNNSATLGVTEDDKHTVANFTFTNPTPSGTIKVVKTDKDGMTNQGDTSSAGIRFAIVNRSASKVKVGGTEYAVGQVVQILTLNASGTATSSKLPYGKYDVYELRSDSGVALGSNYNNASKGTSTLANDKGYRFNTNSKTNIELHTDEELVEASFENDIVKGGLKIRKVSENSDQVKDADASVQGIRFAVVNDSAGAVKVGSSTYAKGTVVKILTLNSQGEASTGSTELPYGTYKVYELRKDATIAVGDTYAGSSKLGNSDLANDSHLYKANTQSFTVHTQGQVEEMTTAFENTPVPVSVSIQKTDKEVSEAKAQGDASLAGIRYAVINRSQNAAYVGGQSIGKGYVAQILTTNAQGKAQDAAGSLPYGTYDVVELREDATIAVGEKYDGSAKLGTSIYANEKGYLFEEKTVSLVLHEAGQVGEASFENAPAKGGVLIQKIDKESGKAEAQGQATLKDTEVTIYNNSTAAVKVNGQIFAKGAAVMTLTLDENGKAESGVVLPYGSYFMKETKAPEGYNLNETWRVDFQIRENEKVVDTSKEDADHKINRDTDTRKSGWYLAAGTEDAGKQEEQIIRGDITFSKIDIDGRKMAYIPLLVTLLGKDGEVLEQHVILADSQGRVNTSTRSKTNVNSLDQYYQDGEYTGPLDDPAAAVNIWFGEDSEASKTAKLGSLVYGNYRVEELKCSLNEQNAMLTQDMITEGTLSEVFTEGKLFDLNNIFVDLIIHPESDLWDDNSGSKVISAGKDFTVTDTVRYDHLKTYQQYKIQTDIYYVERGKTAEDKILIGTGDYIFYPAKVDATDTAHGTIQNTVTVDSSMCVNGGTVHAVDTFYVMIDGNWVKLVTHAEELNVESQILGVPYMETHAADTATGDHVGSSGTTATISDRILYENLANLHIYRFEGCLIVKETGEQVGETVTQILRINERVGEVVKRGDSYVGPRSGEIVMPAFTYDASLYEGKTLVVYETLYDDDTNEIVIEHSDPEDENQSVHIPKVSTQASDDGTGAHTGAVVKDGKVLDEVKLENLVVGEEYTVTGKFLRKDTMEVIATAEPVTITAENATEYVYITFEVDASELSGISCVAYEYLTHNDVEVGKHEDPEDEDQIVHYPEVRTTAVDGATMDHMGAATAEATIIDTVSLKNLMIGDSYKVVGTLMNQDGTPFLVEGEPLTAESDVFKASEKDMTVEITFTFDANELKGKSVVVFEKLFYVDTESDEPKDPVEVAQHEDPEDEGQTVDYPDGRTEAKDAKTETKHVLAEEKAVVTDTFYYTNLTPGKEYTLKGELVKKSDGSIVATNEVTFTPSEKDGKVELSFEFDVSILQGETLVAFETAEYDKVELIIHRDLEDEDQTVYVPEIRTKAMDKKTGSKLVKAEKNAVVVDTVSYKNLIPGREYTFKGVLVDKNTREKLLINGKEVTAELTTVVETADGEVEMTFTFDASELKGGTLVVFETVEMEGKVIGRHEDPSDPEQTVYIPEIQTTLTDTETKDHIAKADEDITLIDLVEYKNLEKGKTYTVIGTLMDKATGDPILDDDGQEITAQTEFTAEKANGSVELAFTFKGVTLKGKTVVAFEKLLFEEDEVAVHADINDEAQTVYFPDGKTSAKDAKTETKMVKAEAEATVIDTFFYENLIPGKEYTLKGELVKKSDGSVVATNETTFTPSEKDGKVELSFEFDASILEGETLVAFETVEYRGIELIIHRDLDDEDQTVYVPKARTSAKDTKTNTREAFAENEVILEDTVFFWNLIPGKEYTAEGRLVDKATGEDILSNGQPVTASATFTAEEADGSVVLTFTFDGSALEGKTIVAFEKILFEGKEVAAHADINDQAQTITFPKIRTQAHTADQQKSVNRDKGIVELHDNIYYENLIPGQMYWVKAQVINKATGEPMPLIFEEGAIQTDDPTVALSWFIPETESGSLYVAVKVDISKLEECDLVFFEELWQDNPEEKDDINRPSHKIAEHKDLNDKDQTIHVYTVPKTGDSNSMTLYSAGLFGTMLALAAMIFAKKRRKEESES